MKSDKMKTKRVAKLRRRGRVRAKIQGTTECPRLAVYRSLSHIEAQLIDDSKGQTIVAVIDNKEKGTKTERAVEVGKKIAEAAIAKKIKTVVFDRGGYQYHGRIKALAEGAREGGLEF